MRLEGELWKPGREWEAALRDLQTRFSRVRELDVDQLLALPVAQTMARLRDWAGDDIDLDRTMARFLDENLSRFLRPDPTVRRAVKEQAPVEIESALGEASARAILRHLGLERYASDVSALA